MRSDEWNQCCISLVSQARPTLSMGHEALLWEALKALGGTRLTLDPIVDLCERLGYRTEASAGIRESVKLHLRKLALPNRNIVLRTPQVPTPESQDLTIAGIVAYLHLCHDRIEDPWITAERFTP